METKNLILAYVFTIGFVALVLIAIIRQAKSSYYSSLEIKNLRKDVEELKKKLGINAPDN